MYKTAPLDASYTCSVCVLPHGFSLIYLHGFLTALHRGLASIGLILSCLASPQPCQCCLSLDLGLGIVKTA